MTTTDRSDTPCPACDTLLDGDGYCTSPGCRFEGKTPAPGGSGGSVMPSPSSTCRHCNRRIVLRNGSWIDPQATGGDWVWRETCDAHDTFVADHEPTEQEASNDE